MLALKKPTKTKNKNKQTNTNNQQPFLMILKILETLQIASSKGNVP